MEIEMDHLFWNLTIKILILKKDLQNSKNNI